MSITAARLLVHVGYDDSEADRGLKNTQGKVSAASVAIGSAIGNLAANYLQQLPGAVYGAMTGIEDALMPVGTLVGTSSQQFADLSGAIKDVISNSPKSADEVGGAAYMILSSGITDTAAATDALQQSLKLAAAGLGDTGQATDLITSAMNSFSTEQLSAEDAAKTFFGTIASGKTTTAGLAQGFGAIAPLASSAGIKFNDLMAATAALTATGMPASQAYSGLKGAITGVIAPSAEAAETAKQLGLDFSQAHLAAVGLPTFLDEIATATGGNIEVMAQLFGSVEGLNSVLALTGPQSVAFKGNLTNIATAGENLDARAKEVNDTLSNKLATAKNKAMVHLSDLGNNGLNWLGEQWTKHGETVKYVAGEIVGGVRAFVSAFKAGDGDITSNGFPGFMERLAYSARLAVNFIIDNWPRVREVVTNVVGSVISFVETNWPKLQATFTQFVGYLQAEVFPYVEQGFNTAREVIGTVVQFVQDNWPKVAEIIGQVVSIIGSALELLVSITQVQIEIVTGIWDRYGTQITAVVQWAFDLITGIIGGALDIIQGIIKTATALIHGDWSGAWEGIKQVASGAWDIIKSVIGGALDAIKGLGEAAWNFLKDKASATWDAIVGQVSGLGGRITSAASGMWDSIWSGFRDVVNRIIGGWNNISFDVPGVDVPFGPDIPGFSVSVPQLPYLAQGGSVYGAGWAVVGERGPETVFLPQGASVAPLPANYGAAGGTTVITVNMPPGSNGDDVVRALKQYERRNGRVPIRTN